MKRKQTRRKSNKRKNRLTKGQRWTLERKLKLLRTATGELYLHIDDLAEALRAADENLGKNESISLAREWVKDR